MSLTKVEYTVETMNILAAAAFNWLFKSTLLQKIQEKSSWNISNEMFDVKKQLHTAINQNVGADLKIRGNINDLDINSVLAYTDELSIRIVANGDLSIKYSK